MSGTKKDLEEQCRWIVEKIEALADENKLYDMEKDCFVDRDSLEDPNDYDEGRYQSLWDYIADNLGIKIITSLDGSEYYGAEICVAWGGPNIYIETRDSYVRGYWGDEVSIPLSYYARDAIDEIIDELRSCY